MYTKRKSRICKINRQKANGFLSVFLCLRSKRPMHAKRGVFVHALRVQVRGGVPTPREMPRSGKDIVATATRIFAAGGRKARAACCPDRGKLSAYQKVPKRKRFYVLFASTKRTKSSRRAAALSTPGERFKTLSIIIFS